MIRKRPITEERTLAEMYLREASRWGTIASEEKNPLIAVLHANFALCCAGVATALSDKQRLSRAFDIDVDAMVSDITEVQNTALRALGQACPSVKPRVELARASGWV
jgi:hypothetical protein